MPSKREQFNVRMSDETAAKVERLHPVVNAALGVELSQAQFFALAVAALEEKYQAAGAAGGNPGAPVASTGRTRKKGAKK